LRREINFRLGTVEEETRSIERHLTRYKDTLDFLDHSANSLRSLEDKGSYNQLARWYRLYWEKRRDTVLNAPGVDPMLPDFHARMKEIDETLQRRFHGVLAKATHENDEVDKLEADWPLLEQRLNKARVEHTALSNVPTNLH
jgi:hypothetical protein